MYFSARKNLKIKGLGILIMCKIPSLSYSLGNQQIAGLAHAERIQDMNTRGKEAMGASLKLA